MSITATQATATSAATSSCVVPVVADEVAVVAEGSTLSKKQQKRLEKRARAEAGKQRKKDFEKAKKEQQKQSRLQQWDQATEEEREQKRQKRISIIQERKQQDQESKAAFLRALEEGPKVVIDLDFASLMSEREIRSLCQQLMFSWAYLKRSKKPVQVGLCGLAEGSPIRTCLMQKSGITSWKMEMKASSFAQENSDPNQIVYLTADSPNVLQTLEPAVTYVVGGIVDHNRNKNLTLERAKASGVRHARLPLQETLDFSQPNKFSKVLTVDHVIAVLTLYNETKDWTSAFQKVIPSRKHISTPQPQPTQPGTTSSSSSNEKEEENN